MPQGGRNYKTITTIALAGYWLPLFLATHVPQNPIPPGTGVSDKLQHYVAYAGLSILAAWWVAARRAFTLRLSIAVMAAMALYGAADELLQALVGRETDLLDWRADLVGAASGLIIFLVLRAAYRRRMHRIGGANVETSRH